MRRPPRSRRIETGRPESDRAVAPTSSARSADEAPSERLPARKAHCRLVCSTFSMYTHYDQRGPRCFRTLRLCDHFNEGRDRVWIGRRRENDLALDDPKVSKLLSPFHCCIEAIPGKSELHVRDNGSDNGTYVNNRRLAAFHARPLVNGDVVSFGGPMMVLYEGVVRKNPYHFAFVSTPPVSELAEVSESEEEAICAICMEPHFLPVASVHCRHHACLRCLRNLRLKGVASVEPACHTCRTAWHADHLVREWVHLHGPPLQRAKADEASKLNLIADMGALRDTERHWLCGVLRFDKRDRLASDTSRANFLQSYRERILARFPGVRHVQRVVLSDNAFAVDDTERMHQFIPGVMRSVRERLAEEG
ncbi:hypothetical protein CYMTET_4528 [Cymbomonas tetramitiformis]|uniref:Uncharacterized protein n=1 Tax=Cymbomonas tetramitiformis TaxID=36881 RepID=A0AAE0LKE2_9CHLO|nr:hypothetical protein CYMTET_4528 [Cymbomonas tetramitiformis]